MAPSVLWGRVVRDGDPLWLQEDTDLALALTELDAERCSGCGHQMSESMDPALEFEWTAESVRCHACATRERAADKAGDMGAGVRWVATRRTDGQPEG